MISESGIKLSKKHEVENTCDDYSVILPNKECQACPMYTKKKDKYTCYEEVCEEN